MRMPRMSPALLSQRLKELEQAGLVMRRPVRGEPGTLDYRLTEAGDELKPLIEATWHAMSATNRAQAEADAESADVRFRDDTMASR